MYTPSAFKMSELDKLFSHMRQHSFATLVTNGKSGLTATHLPLWLDSAEGEQGVLYGHMARANPQWRDVSGEVLAIFPGPHAYVSPTWYAEPGTVPTWNYVSVHAYGKLELIEDDQRLHDILSKTVAFYEQAMPQPWSYKTEDAEINNMLKAIVGFRIAIERLEGKAKLNQNHSQERRDRVIHQLQSTPDDNSQSIARLMREL